VSTPAPSIIIAGHSHIVSLGVPLKSPNRIYEIVGLGIEGASDKVAGFTGKWPRENVYWNELAKVVPGKTIALSWQGNQHLSRFMFSPNPRIDFVLSTNPDLPLDEEATIVPELMLRELFRPSMEQLEKTLKRLDGAGAARILVLGTPPPKDDDSFCRQRLGKERTFAARAGKLGVDLASIELSPAILRYKYWALLQNMMRETAGRACKEFIPIPLAAQAPAGFLRRELWADDITHANRDYGKLVLKDLEELVE
jgi:hypothetical protein